ncbi:MAG: hypothetical protein H8E79_01605 [Desulfobulbaceae bacterium]|uniref:Uncharacterized protein n=1 Tax=Candidatus Desulfatifera sulfidica TaxID=2841691 RepID=A0A8J6TBG5_9BACT|nr:hypothetical protein [Candidatus Desulfatifera sulfidica]
MLRLLVAFTCLSLFVACSSNDPDDIPSSDQAPQEAAIIVKPTGCKQCHPVQMDPQHDFSCSTCHGGDESGNDRQTAHAGLISQPAHPTVMAETCGSCHPDQVSGVGQSLHFTLNNSVNLVRRAFGATEDVADLTSIPVHASPASALELADDMLRRRCLRCHVYTPGDDYPSTSRATGCASCHLEYSGTRMVSHAFLSTPDDQQCLQCHYGNRVGFDYHGRYEQDLNEEYRTPYITRDEYIRPYGVESHKLSTDIHQQRGMICIDCHQGTNLMNTDDQETLSCASCHDPDLLARNLPPQVFKDNGKYTLLSRASGQEHNLPLMSHPAHATYNRTVDCQVCHGQWAYNDRGTHLLRSDTDNYDDFLYLTVQGSSVVENFLDNNLDFDADEIDPVMADTITNEQRQGIWYRGFTTRRWEDPILGRDETGKIRVMRPILDLHLSWIDEDDEVRFDSVSATDHNKGLRPYTPHTTGPAGMFYQLRINTFLAGEKAAVDHIQESAADSK